MGAALPKFRGCEFMPLRLKDVMLKHGISQSVIADGVLQTGGRPVSKTTISFILNYGYFPRGTPVDTIKGQIADFLRAHKVPEDEIAICWEVSDEDQTKSRMPIGVHLRALEARSPKKAEPKQAQEIDFQPMEIEMLSPAAKRHFKLFRDPFVDDVAGPDDVFLSEDQRYVLEAMMQTAKAGGITAIIGESGSGKTTLRKLFQNRIARDGQAIRVIFPHTLDKTKLSTGQICQAIIRDIEEDSQIRSSLEAQSRQVKEVLLRSSRAGNKHVLMIEEAHDLSIQTLKYLKRFHEIESDDGFGKVLSIVLVAQPELRIKLDVSRHPEAREFINRCEVASLSPLYEQLKTYVTHKFERVGISPTFIEDSAYDAIRERWTKVDPTTRAIKNNLYPLIVNNTITRALNRAAELGLPVINAELIKDL